MLGLANHLTQPDEYHKQQLLEQHPQQQLEIDNEQQILVHRAHMGVTAWFGLKTILVNLA